ncbi:MAG: hypothetical protein A3A81_04940 [Omnitrophica bacterium RIFCSPLOWO2_01_FULL_45_10b]|nr:MAG: hypothetical protein A3A81_04940 [Omnitrophica bacterium RIFCSPLOWO2_01_FULL_45_10b]
MKIIFLCAGYGTRLYPLTENQPKALLEIGGEVLLSYLLDKVRLLPSLTSVTVVSNDRFYDHFCKWQKKLKPSISINVLNDGTKDPESRLGAIQDLKLALEKEDIKEDILVLAGDNFFDSDLASFVTFAQAKTPAVSVGVYDVQDRERAQKYGLIKADSSGKITTFLEKPKDPPTTLASMGVYYFPKDTLVHIDRFLEANRNSDAPGYYVSWLSKKINVYAYVFSGAWFDIGDLNSYREADQYLRERGAKQKVSKK